uniref:Uncharacterized protein n=1 Tax=Oryza barthii TaxID=65489 RepID=A0A0D3F862_9ORYZ
MGYLSSSRQQGEEEEDEDNWPHGGAAGENPKIFKLRVNKTERFAQHLRPRAGHRADKRAREPQPRERSEAGQAIRPIGLETLNPNFPFLQFSHPQFVPVREEGHGRAYSGGRARGSAARQPALAARRSAGSKAEAATNQQGLKPFTVRDTKEF